MNHANDCSTEITGGEETRRAPTDKDSRICHKDEYHEDPLPDLVGNLKVTEEPEPDITAIEQQYELEDFEFNITSSEDEENEDLNPEEDFFNLDYSSSSNSTFISCSENSLLENEKVSLELEQTEESGSVVRAEGTSSSPVGHKGLKHIADRAKLVASKVSGVVSKRKIAKNTNIKVVYHNLDKPYSAKVSPSLRYKNFLTLGEDPEGGVIGGGMSQSSSINSIGTPVDLSHMTPEEIELAKSEWKAELAQLEDEIQTLRQVLHAKMKRAHELKRKLGVSVWSELSTDVNQGFKNVRESNAVHKIEETFSNVSSAVTQAPIYQKTESAIKATAERTTSLLGGFGSAVSSKIGALKNTDSFRSMEERVFTAVDSVKTKMGGSRSGSVQSFDEALREATAANQNQGENLVPDAEKANGTQQNVGGTVPTNPEEQNLLNNA